MSDLPTCSTCRWWGCLMPNENDEVRRSSGGECHRHAPGIAVNRNGAALTRFPETAGSNFCGEHAPRATATFFGVDMGSGDDRTVIFVPTVEELIRIAHDHGADFSGVKRVGASFTVGRTTWVFRPLDSSDAPPA